MLRPSPEWLTTPAPVAYPDALAAMEARAAAIRDAGAPEHFWLLEHPPLYTAGTSADPAELLDPRFEVVEAGRGGSRQRCHGQNEPAPHGLASVRRGFAVIHESLHSAERLGW